MSIQKSSNLVHNLAATSWVLQMKGNLLTRLAINAIKK